MERRGLELRLEAGIAGDAEALEIEEATRQLRGELLDLDVEDVRQPLNERLPEGARAAEVGILGTLLVTAGTDVIGALVQTIVSWVKRGKGRSLKLQIDGDVLELSHACADDQRRAVEAFFARHDQREP